MLRSCAAWPSSPSSFLVFQIKVLQQPLLWNHVVGFAVVLLGVLIVLGGPFTSEVGAAEGVALPVRVSAKDLQRTSKGLPPVRWELPSVSPPPPPSASGCRVPEVPSPLGVTEPPSAEPAARLAWTADA